MLDSLIRLPEAIEFGIAPGSLPLNLSIRQQADAGRPTVGHRQRNL